MIIPVCVVLFVQYFGSFAFTSKLPKTVLSLLRYDLENTIISSILGICSSEDVIPLTESLIIGSAAFYKQFAFNSHLMTSFIIIAVLCIVMHWLTTEHVSACMEGVLKVVYWIRDACQQDRNLESMLHGIMEEEKNLMEEMATMIRFDGSTPSPCCEEFDFSHVEKEEVVDENASKKLKQIERKLKILQKKRLLLLKSQARKESIQHFVQGLITSLSQFISFVLRHLSEFLLCTVITIMTTASISCNQA